MPSPDDWPNITSRDAGESSWGESRFRITPRHTSDAEVLRQVAELALLFPNTPVSIVCASGDQARAIYQEARRMLDPAGCDVTFIPERCHEHRADGQRCALIHGHEGGHA